MGLLRLLPMSEISVTVEVCEAILEDEEAMAEKLTVELPEITSTYLELLFLSERRKLIAVQPI